MDYHSLPRKHLQALCKKHGIAANSTNAAMADNLLALLKSQPPQESSKLLEKRVTRASHADAESGNLQGLKSSTTGAREENITRYGDAKIGKARVREHRSRSLRCMEKSANDADCEASSDEGQSNVKEDSSSSASEKHSHVMKDAITNSQGKKSKTSGKLVCKRKIKVRSPGCQSKIPQLKEAAAEKNLDSSKDKLHRKKGTVTFSDVIEVRVRDAETCTDDIQCDALVDRKTINRKIEKRPGTCTRSGLRYVSSSARVESADLCKIVGPTRGKTDKRSRTKASEDAGKVAVAEQNELRGKQDEEYLPRRSRRLTLAASELNLNHIAQPTTEDSEVPHDHFSEGIFVGVNVSEDKASLRRSRRLTLPAGEIKLPQIHAIVAEEKVDNSCSVTASEEGCQVKTRDAIASKKSVHHKPKQSQEVCRLTKPASRTAHKSTDIKDRKSMEADFKSETRSRGSTTKISASYNKEKSKQHARNKGDHTQSAINSSKMTLERLDQDKQKYMEPFKQKSRSHKIFKSKAAIIETSAKANAKGKSRTAVPSVKKKITISIQSSFEELARNGVASAGICAKFSEEGEKSDTNEAIFVHSATENQETSAFLFGAQKSAYRTNCISQTTTCGEEEQNNSAGESFHGLLTVDDPSSVSTDLVAESQTASSHEDESLTSLSSKCAESISALVMLDKKSCSSAVDMKDGVLICLHDTVSNQVHDEPPKASEDIQDITAYINEANKHHCESHQVNQTLSRTDDRAVHQEQDREADIQSLEQDQDSYVTQARANLLEQEQDRGKCIDAGEINGNYVSENEKIQIIVENCEMPINCMEAATRYPIQCQSQDNDEPIQTVDEVGEVCECYSGNTTRIEEMQTSKHQGEHSNELHGTIEIFGHDFGGFVENAAKTEVIETSEVKEDYSDEGTEDRGYSDKDSYRMLDNLVHASGSFAEYAAIAEGEASETEDDYSEEKSENEGYSQEKSEETYSNKPLKSFSERLAEVCGNFSEGDQETFTIEEESADEESSYSSEEEEYSSDEFLSMSEEEKDSGVDCSDKEERYADREDSEGEEEWSSSDWEEEECPSECENDELLLSEEIEDRSKIQGHNPDKKNSLDAIDTHHISDAIHISMGMSANDEGFLGINSGETSTNSSITELLCVAPPTWLEEISSSYSQCWFPSTNWTTMQLVERERSPSVLVKNDDLDAERLEETEVGRMVTRMLGTNENLDSERCNKPEEQEICMDILDAVMNDIVDSQVLAEEMGVRTLDSVGNDSGCIESSDKAGVGIRIMGFTKSDDAKGEAAIDERDLAMFGPVKSDNYDDTRGQEEPDLHGKDTGKGSEHKPEFSQAEGILILPQDVELVNTLSCKHPCEAHPLFLEEQSSSCLICCSSLKEPVDDQALIEVFKANEEQEKRETIEELMLAENSLAKPGCSTSMLKSDIGNLDADRLKQSKAQGMVCQSLTVNGENGEQGLIKDHSAASLDATSNEVSCLVYPTSLEESSSSLQCLSCSVDLSTCQTVMQLLKSNRDEKLEESSTTHKVKERSVFLVSQADFQSVETGDNISPGTLDKSKPQVEMSRDKAEASKTVSEEDSLSSGCSHIQILAMNGEESRAQIDEMNIDDAEESKIVTDENVLSNDNDDSQMLTDDGCRISIVSSELKEKDVKQFSYEVHGVQSVFLEQATPVDPLANERNSTCSRDDQEGYTCMSRYASGITGKREKEEKDLDEVEGSHGVKEQCTHEILEVEAQAQEHDPSPERDAVCNTGMVENGENIYNEMEQIHDVQEQCVDEIHDLQAWPQEPDNPSPQHGATCNIGLMEKEQNTLDEIQHSCGVQEECLKHDEADGQILECHFQNPKSGVDEQPTKLDDKIYGIYKLEATPKENNVSAGCIPCSKDEKASGLAIKTIMYAEIPVHKFYSLPKPPLQKPEDLASKCEGVARVSQSGLSHNLERSISSNAETAQFSSEVNDEEVKMPSMDSPATQSGLSLSNLSKPWQEHEELARKREGGAQVTQTGLSESHESSISSNFEALQLNSEGNDAYEATMTSMDFRSIQSELERQSTSVVQVEQFNSEINDALAVMAETPRKEMDDNNAQQHKNQGIKLAESTPILIERNDANRAVSKENQVSARKNISNETGFPPRSLASGNKRLALKALPANVSQTPIGGQATPSAKFQHTPRPRNLLPSYEGSPLAKAAGNSSPQLPQAPRSSKRDRAKSHLLR